MGPLDTRRHEKGIYLIEKAAEAVSAVLRTAARQQPPQRLGLFGRVTSAEVMHQRQMPI